MKFLKKTLLIGMEPMKMNGITFTIYYFRQTGLTSFQNCSNKTFMNFQRRH